MHMTLAWSLVWIYAIALPKLHKAFKIFLVTLRIKKYSEKEMFGLGTATGAIVSLLITITLLITVSVVCLHKYLLNSGFGCLF